MRNIFPQSYRLQRMKMSVLDPKAMKPQLNVIIKIFQEEIEEEEVVSEEEVEANLIRETFNVIIVIGMVILKMIAN